MKKLLALGMVTVLTVTMLSGCKKQKDINSDVSDSSSIGISEPAYTIDDSGNIIDATTGKKVTDNTISTDSKGNIVDKETGEVITKAETVEKNKVTASENGIENVTPPKNTDTGSSGTATSSENNNSNQSSTVTEKPSPTSSAATPSQGTTSNTVSGNKPNNSNSAVSSSKPSVTSSQTPTTHTHSWGEWVITVRPTYTKGGTDTRTCKGCGKKETRSTPTLVNRTYLAKDYGVSFEQMYADCKAYALSKGVRWDSTLTRDNSGWEDLGTNSFGCLNYSEWKKEMFEVMDFMIKDYEPTDVYVYLKEEDTAIYFITLYF